MNQYLGLQVHLANLERMKQLMSFFALHGYMYKKGKHALHWVVSLRGQKLEIMREVHDKLDIEGEEPCSIK